MRYLKELCALALYAMCLSVTTYAQDFSDAMKNIFKGRQYKDFQWLTYPLDNYGVGTAYSNSQRQFLCDTFPCLGISPPPDPAKNLEGWIQVINPGTNVAYSAKGGGPSADLSNAANRKLFIGAVLPQILSVIGI